MTRKMLKSKIHRATVTGADLNYEGSVTIDPLLLEAADMLEYEFVNVWNVTCGSRFDTYVLKGQPGSGTICINGSSARLVQPGDLVIIASWQDMSDEAAHKHQPKLVFVNEKNQQVDLERKKENPGQGERK